MVDYFQNRNVYVPGAWSPNSLIPTLLPTFETKQTKGHESNLILCSIGEISKARRNFGLIENFLKSCDQIWGSNQNFEIEMIGKPVANLTARLGNYLATHKAIKYKHKLGFIEFHQEVADNCDVLLALLPDKYIIPGKLSGIIPLAMKYEKKIILPSVIALKFQEYLQEKDYYMYSEQETFNRAMTNVITAYNYS